ncbi:MAG TPA: thiamine diphosphokinase [Firmicutes bacterium]|nr:thiamine diphosphokinase [Bacillota bacterium]
MIGAWGGRLDHSLANLLLFAPFAKQGYRISMTDGVTDAYLVTEELVLECCQGKQVSIIALSPSAQGVTAQGFHWPLEAATLHWGQAIGISNIPVDDIARVQVKEGILLVIVTPED